MFRRRVQGRTCYDVYIDKGMLPGSVDIYVDGRLAKSGVTDDHALVCSNVPAGEISVSGDVVERGTEKSYVVTKVDGKISG